jgi:hypothetical protein
MNAINNTRDQQSSTGETRKPFIARRPKTMNKIQMAQMEVGATWDWFPARIHTGRHGQKYARRVMANGATRKKAVVIKSVITINDQGSLKNNRRIAEMEYELKLARAEREAA